MLLRPPRSTRTDTLFPYTTLFRSLRASILSRTSSMTISKAIILSAGQGSRLLPLTSDMPKCMIDFNGRTLIEWQIEALKANGVRHISVVTGYRTQRVEDHLAAVDGVRSEEHTSELQSLMRI